MSATDPVAHVQFSDFAYIVNDADEALWTRVNEPNQSWVKNTAPYQQVKNMLTRTNFKNQSVSWWLWSLGVTK